MDILRDLSEKYTNALNLFKETFNLNKEKEKLENVEYIFDSIEKQENKAFLENTGLIKREYNLSSELLDQEVQNALVKRDGDIKAKDTRTMEEKVERLRNLGVHTTVVDPFTHKIACAGKDATYIKMLSDEEYSYLMNRHTFIFLGGIKRKKKI